MKKSVLAALAAVFMAGAAFAEAGNQFMNVKLGFDVSGSIEGKGGGYSTSQSEAVDMGITLSGEYLYAATDIFSFGGGLQYLFQREIDASYGGGKISYLPIYVTAQAYPVKNVKGAFFKANLGYSILFDVDEPYITPVDVDHKGGLYWAIGTGYEFPFDLTLEVTYDTYYSESSGLDTTDWIYHKIGLNVGWKIRI